MAKPRTKAEREADRDVIAQMVLQKRTIDDIAQRIGRNRNTVLKDLRFLEERWLQSADRLTAARRAEELARIDRLEYLAWEAYERSITTREVTKTVLEQGEKGTRTKAETRKEELIGDPKWLDKVCWCVEQRAKILGLYAPTKSEGRFEHQHHHTVQTEFDREFERLVGRLDQRGEGLRPREGEKLPRGFSEPS